MTDFSGPKWDLHTEYESTSDPRVNADLQTLEAFLERIESENAEVLHFVDVSADFSDSSSDLVERLCVIYELGENAYTLLSNLETFTDCLLSVDGLDEEARAFNGRLTPYQVRYLEAMQPSKQCLKVAPDRFIEQYLDDARVSPSRFAVLHTRQLKDRLLPLAQENLVNGLAQDGVHAWSQLYEQLSSSIQCDVSENGKVRSVGLAEASSLTQSTEDAVREDAWRAINRGWTTHLDTCAAAINSIAGWNLEMCRRRSSKQAVHYIDSAIHSNRYQQKTLDAVMEVAATSKPIAQRAARALAKAYGKTKFGPWDQRAPAPRFENVQAKIPFSEGLEIVANSYGKVHRDMHDFVRMMENKSWIEGTVEPNKRPGAYCTGFAKSRTPRVYMTYAGSMTDITILAHELGHAYHHWTLRDLPKSQRSYGMSLAETASTFGETLVRDALLSRAESPEAKLQVAWEEISAIVTFLLNIPTRYEFERNFYDARQERPLLATELCKLMHNAWFSWYGDSLAEADDLFWVNKLHFYFSSISFYNFPYLFGYLFSQSVYQRKDTMGGQFFERYNSLLEDTGRMTAEDLAEKHLDVDITQPEFWQQTVTALEPRITHFENLCEQVLK